MLRMPCRGSARRRAARPGSLALGWNLSPRLGSPQIIHRRTAGYLRLAAVRKSANARGRGAWLVGRPPLAQAGEVITSSAGLMS